MPGTQRLYPPNSTPCPAVLRWLSAHPRAPSHPNPNNHDNYRKRTQLPSLCPLPSALVLWGGVFFLFASATNDITDNFAQVLNRAENNNAFAGLAGPGKWNDPDMLEVGNTLTDAEGRSHFSLWCLMKAPLLIGNFDFGLILPQFYVSVGILDSYYGSSLSFS